MKYGGVDLDYWSDGRGSGLKRDEKTEHSTSNIQHRTFNYGSPHR
jgi:hypothetical protein